MLGGEKQRGTQLTHQLQDGGGKEMEEIAEGNGRERVARECVVMGVCGEERGCEGVRGEGRGCEGVCGDGRRWERVCGGQVLS